MSGLNRTKIEWSDYVWNVTTGCNGPNGQRCSYCFARRMSARFKRSFAPTMHPERLNLPYRTKTPSRVFVDSNGDLFDPCIPDEFIDKVFAVMSLCQRFAFQLLTKQAKRMAEYFGEQWQLPSGGKEQRFDQVAERAFELSDSENPEHWTTEGGIIAMHNWPLSNVHIGITAEDQKRLDERWPYLRDTPAAVRWVRLEPLRSYVRLDMINTEPGTLENALWWERSARINWVVVGAETGPGARPPKLEWIHSIVNQCQAARTPLFMKANLARVWPGPLIQQFPEVRSAYKCREDDNALRR